MAIKFASIFDAHVHRANAILEKYGIDSIRKNFIKRSFGDVISIKRIFPLIFSSMCSIILSIMVKNLSDFEYWFFPIISGFVFFSLSWLFSDKVIQMARPEVIAVG